MGEELTYPKLCCNLKKKCTMQQKTLDDFSIDSKSGLSTLYFETISLPTTLIRSNLLKRYPEKLEEWKALTYTEYFNEYFRKNPRLDQALYYALLSSENVILVDILAVKISQKKRPTEAELKEFIEKVRILIQPKSTPFFEEV